MLGSDSVVQGLKGWWLVGSDPFAQTDLCDTEMGGEMPRSCASEIDTCNAAWSETKRSHKLMLPRIARVRTFWHDQYVHNKCQRNKSVLAWQCVEWQQPSVKQISFAIVMC